MRPGRSILVFAFCALLGTGCGEVREVRDASGRVVERGPVFLRDGEPVRHGMWTGWHPGGERAWKVRFVRGTPVGLRREWHASGARAAEIKLGWDGQPVPNARHKRWTEDGEPVKDPPEKQKDERHG